MGIFSLTEIESLTATGFKFLNTGTGIFVEVLFPETGSFSNPLIVAVLEYVPVLFTRTVIFKVSMAPLVKIPIDQRPVLDAYKPLLSSETKVKPEGSRSVTFTPVALLGPLFVAVNVKTILLPVIGVELFTVFTIERSHSALTVI